MKSQAGRMYAAAGTGLPIQWDDVLETAWTRWLQPYENKVHHAYEVASPDLPRHTDAAYRSARLNIDRVLESVRRQSPWREPGKVLDHGSSAGFNAFALQTAFPDGQVVGIDPDRRAVDLAQAMARRLAVDAFPRAPRFVRARGESLPFADDSFDLVVSVTVLEHVADVDRCVAEMARVLRPGGVIYLETPNYTWPFEPHLRVIMPPRCPKRLLRALARWQGSAANVGYIDHLQLVHSDWVETSLRRSGLCWRNVFADKLQAAMDGRLDGVVAHRRLAMLIRAVGRMGLSGPARTVVLASGFYPSLMYLAYEPPSGGRRC